MLAAGLRTRGWLPSALAGVLLAASPACASGANGANGANGEKSMTPAAVDDAVFFGLELPSWKPNPATPTRVGDERGLRIAAPRQVPVGADMTLPVCVVASFEAAVWDALPERFWPHLVAVVQDGQGRQLATRNLGDTTPLRGERDSAPLPAPAADSGPRPAAAGAAKTGPGAEVRPPDPPFPGDPPDAAPGGEPTDDAPTAVADSATGYYNFDLLKLVDLPRKAGAEYVVFLTYARFHSNSVRVRFVPAKP